MKKWIAFILAVLMMASLAVITASAKQDDPTRIFVSEGDDLADNQADGTNPGWRNSRVDANQAPLKMMDLEGELAVGAILTGSAAEFHHTVRFLYYTNTPIDISEMKYLEFDFYISDASYYTNNINLELTSSGRQDYEEMSIYGSVFKLVDGWNHIRIALSDMKQDTSPAGPLDLTKWNFFRLCLNGAYDLGSERLVLAIDNLRFWNGVDEATVEVLEMVEELKEYNSVSKITEKNYKIVRAKVNAARAAYDALSDEAKEVVKDYEGLRVIMTADSAVDKFEASLPKEEEKTDDTQTDTTGSEEPTQNSGCKGAISIGGGALMVLAAVWMSMNARKKED